MTRVDFSRVLTADIRKAHALAAAKEAAYRALADQVEHLSADVFGSASEAERSLWPEKTIAARAILAGTATPSETTLIEAETEATGESVANLAEKIVTRSDETARRLAKITGLRRAVTAEIDCAEDIASVDLLLARLHDV